MHVCTHLNWTRIAECCNVLECVAVCCSMFHCIHVHIQIQLELYAKILQRNQYKIKIQIESILCVYTFPHADCSASQCGAMCCTAHHTAVCCSVLQCVAVCCSVLQCVAVCCSVLQCVVCMYVRKQLNAFLNFFFIICRALFKTVHTCPWAH